MSLRTIIVNSSNGIPALPLETLAQTWGELRRDFDNNNISYHGMKVIIGETKQSLEHDSALLPEGTLNMFLLPRKTKSGITKKSDMTKKTPVTKKSATAAKKVAAKKTVLPKKGAVVKSSISKEKEESAKEHVKVVMRDIDKLQDAVTLLKLVNDERVKTKLLLVLTELDDISYIVATGKPRIDNLKSKQTACQLANSGVFDTKDC